jgi:hypothetical protein
MKSISLFLVLFFSCVVSTAQVKEGLWTVAVTRSPMGDRSFMVASSPAATMFQGGRPRLVIACEVVRDGVSRGLNVFVDIGSPLMLTEHFKAKSVPVSVKIDDAKPIQDNWHQSETFREIFHDSPSDAEQRAFIRWLSDSKLLIVEFSILDKTQAFGFTTSGLKPYVPVLAQACGWHK